MTKRHVGENKLNIYANSRVQYTSDSYHNAGTNYEVQSYYEIERRERERGE